MKHRKHLGLILLFTAGVFAQPGKPNIVLIFADDLGYGDIGCYNPESRIPTPHIDRLAKEGIRFTDAHSADSVCTPSRYGLLTGRYCWRTNLKTGVLFNWEPPLIEPGRVTLASLLKQHGYRTALSGKWHLGLGFTAKPDRPVAFDNALPWPGGRLPDRSISESIELSTPVFGGPETLGFDEAFYTAGCSTDQEPFCFIENGRMLNMDGASYRNPPGSWRSGMAAPDWDNETVDVRFTERALRFIDDCQDASPEQPFFVYLPLSSPHSPHVTANFARGRSKAGARGDMVWLVDWAVGQIASKLAERELTENTLVIVASDNGPLPGSLEIGKSEGTAKITNGHKSMGDLRGRKGRVWEGGHRVPFIARWPGRIPADTISDYAFCFTDLLATFASLLETSLPEGAGEDSVDMLPALLGKDLASRPAIVHHSNHGYALREGDWKIVFGQAKANAPITPAASVGHLFNLKTDLYETHDQWNHRPEIVARLTKRFKEITQTK